MNLQLKFHYSNSRTADYMRGWAMGRFEGTEAVIIHENIERDHSPFVYISVTTSEGACAVVKSMAFGEANMPRPGRSS